MKRLIPFILLISLLFSFGVAQAEEAKQKDAYIHFVVLNQTLPDGSDSTPVLTEFKKEVIKLAGGFTELGNTLGGSMDGDMVKHELNISFLIGADRDISLELRKLTNKLFDGDGAFVMSWPGKMVH